MYFDQMSVVFLGWPNWFHNLGKAAILGVGQAIVYQENRRETFLQKIFTDIYNDRGSAFQIGTGGLEAAATCAEK